MAVAQTAQRNLRFMLALLVLWDLGIGIYAVGFADHMQHVLMFAERAEPLFMRGVGVYWLFASFFQFLGWRNPRKFLLAIQLSIVFRLSAAVIDTIEALFLLPKPFYFFHWTLLFFVLMNLLIAYLTVRWLRKMELPWIPS